MIDKRLAAEVLDAALSTGGDFAEIFMEDRRNQSLVLESNRLESVNSGRLHGAGIRVYHGLSAVYAYTNSTDREGLLKCARDAASAIKAEKSGIITAKPFEDLVIANAHPILMRPSQTDTRKKADILRCANAAARKAGEEISQVICSYNDSEQDVLICNSDGLFVTDTRVYSRMSCQAVAGSGSENQTAHEAPGAMRALSITLIPSILRWSALK